MTLLCILLFVFDLGNLFFNFFDFFVVVEAQAANDFGAGDIVRFGGNEGNGGIVVAKEFS